MTELDPLLYKYEVLWGNATDLQDINRWILGKRIQRISVKCGPGGGGMLWLSNHPAVFTTAIELAANESICLAPEGAGIMSLAVELYGPDGKWVIEAWQQQGAV